MVKGFLNVGQSRPEQAYMRPDKWANSKSTQVSIEICIKQLLLLEMCPKTQFWCPLSENLNPLQWPTPYFDLIINKHTEHVKELRMDYHGIHWVKDTGQNSLSHRKTTIGLPVASKKFHTHQLTPADAKPRFTKVCLTSVKLCMLFPTHL